MDFNLLIKSFAIIILIFIGYFFKKKGHFNHQTIESINNLVFKLILPAFLFIAFLGVDFKLKLFVLPLVGIVFASLMLIFGFLISYLFKIKDTYFRFAMTTFEGGMIAYPIFSMIFGADKIFMIALIDLGNAILFFSVIMVMLAKHNDRSILSALKDSLPILGAMFLGIMLNFFGINSLFSGTLVYSVIIEALTLLSIPMITLVTLSIGIDMEFDLKSFISPLKLIFIRYLFAVPLAMIMYLIVLKHFGFLIPYNHALMIFALAPSSLLLPALVPMQERKIMSNLTSLFVPLSLVVLMCYGIFFI